MKDEPVANGILLRGFSKKPDIQPFPEKYKMDALAITTYPMYRGIAKVLGMKAGKEPKSYQEMIQIMKEAVEQLSVFLSARQRNRCCG